MIENDLLTVHEVADRLGQSEQTVRKARAGELLEVRHGKGHARRSESRPTICGRGCTQTKRVTTMTEHRQVANPNPPARPRRPSRS
jgi:hypothetical protein